MKKKSRSPLLLATIVGGGALTILVCFLLGLFDEPGRGGDLLPAETGAGGSSIEIDDPLPNVKEVDRPPEETRPVAGDPPPTGTVRARIIDSLTGLPLTFYTAWIFETGTEDPKKMVRGKTGTIVRKGTGILKFEGLEEGTYTLFVRSGGHQDLIIPDVAVPQSVRLLEYTIGTGTHIRGTVVDDKGEPVAKMLVAFVFTPLTPDVTPPASNTTITDAGGRYLFGDLVPGEYEIRLQSYTDPLVRAEGLLLGRGGGIIKDFVVPSFCTLNFKVQDRFGNLLPNVRIRLHATEGRLFKAKTEPDGEASIDHVPPGEYRLTISKSRFKMSTEMVTVFILAGDLQFERTLEYDI